MRAPRSDTRRQTANAAGLRRVFEDGQRATKHYHATKHPIIKSFQPGENWKWCYVDEVMWE